MSDMLSQDEIDALLRGSAESDETNEKPEIRTDDHISTVEVDALGEIGNISFGSSATALSTLLNQKVEITTPQVSIVDRNLLEEEFPHPYVAIQVQYTEGFSGANLLVIRQSDASIIADLMLGGDGISPSQDLGEIQLSAVQEAMNQMMGSAATSMSTVFRKKVDISPPSINLMFIPKGEGKENLPEEDLLVKVSFALKIGELIDSSIMQLLPLKFAKSLVDELMAPEEVDIHTPSVPIEEPYHAEREVAAAHTVEAPRVEEPSVNVQPAAFADFESPQLGAHEAQNLNMLLDIPLQVTVELGRTNRSVKEILELSSGSIIELDKLAGEPVDILVNSQLMAKGEVVVIDENFGVRITDIVSQSDRLKRLK
ncbi:flagellar motor switch protein FliN [Rossellomorea marisflavi]|jgi:flagellar motor switch protein FliN|uniref:Flagellar motor switch protein FliN n=2 Tax=Rossellomorea marisflavi TaxID=189381 RepID=A0A0M0GQA0_9BACI|nr:flagellar motor switch phosphatase FliY [Rossellomorea marisflavi]KON92100.1 flagellar motor switch protein FliN [Rossellomorea marisflavi]MCM2588707.1 flagellar motor switch phosphatase FliY [Rossellomorea marisflavi]VXC65699.1 flagellar motor switching and energizing phosphatase [Bacillus sp. 349Y]